MTRMAVTTTTVTIDGVVVSVREVGADPLFVIDFDTLMIQMAEWVSSLEDEDEDGS